MKTPYDDKDELATYVWTFFRRFLTPVEGRAWPAVFALAKARIGYVGFAEGLLKSKKFTEDPEVAAILSDGPEAFRLRTAQRIVREHGSDVFIKRCPRCAKIVRTPKARQCLWCGFDWHHASSLETAF